MAIDSRHEPSDTNRVTEQCIDEIFAHIAAVQTSCHGLLWIYVAGILQILSVVQLYCFCTVIPMSSSLQRKTWQWYMIACGFFPTKIYNSTRVRGRRWILRFAAAGAGNLQEILLYRTDDGGPGLNYCNPGDTGVVPRMSDQFAFGWRETGAETNPADVVEVFFGL